MITLREAVNLCKIPDHEVVFLRPQGMQKYWGTPYTVKEIRNRFDMRKTMVVGIAPHFCWCEYDGFEFEIKQ